MSATTSKQEPTSGAFKGKEEKAIIWSRPITGIPTELSKTIPSSLKEEAKPLGEFLKTTVQDALRMRPDPKPLVFVNSDDTLEHVMRTLGRWRILGAPVVEGDRMIGFIDMLDIAVFILANLADPGKVDTLNLQTLTLSGRSISKTAIIEALATHRSSMAVSERDPLIYVCRLFDKGHHRVAVYNEEKKITGILTPTDVLRMLYAHFKNDPRMRPFGDRTMRDYGYTGKGCKIYSISTEARVIDAIARLALTGVNALAVIDPATGVLRGNFSASDLRSFATDEEKLPRMNQSVYDYLTIHSPDSLKPIVERPHTRALMLTIKEMLDNRVHRLWVMDEERRPTGVLAMLDVIHIVTGLVDA